VILSLKQDKIHNKLWIGTQAGLCFYDGKSLQSFSNNAGMPFLNAETLFIDSKNVLWIGHSEGITAYNGETFKSLTKKDGLPDNFVACMTETNPQNPVYWFGIRDSFGRGLGICRYDGISVSYLKHEDGLPNDRIINMITDDDGNIWMGTADGVIRFDGAKFRTIAQEDGC
jgi:ligand-binding sensor domain-containing protein